MFHEEHFAAARIWVISGGIVSKILGYWAIAKHPRL